jgi:hypothetical protein
MGTEISSSARPVHLINRTDFLASTMAGRSGLADLQQSHFLRTGRGTHRHGQQTFFEF